MEKPAQTWCRSRRVLNKLCHIIHGNHPNKPSWHQCHSNSVMQSLSIGTLNSGGLQKQVKRKRLIDLDLDILALNETHMQKHLEKAEQEFFKSYWCFWGLNPECRHFGGVAIFAQKSAFWAVKTVNFPTDNPCQSFVLDNRLIATQLWFGRGGTSMIIYSIYGVSGARWEIQKRSYLHKLLKAIKVDRISRGQIPCILMGDFNMEISESQVLSDALASQFWFDLRTSGDAEQQHKATCHKGKGSYIDHIFVSPHLFDQCFNFQIQEFPEFKDHSVLTANIWVPTAVQTHTSLRPVHTFPTLNRASSASNTFQYQIPRQFKDAISNGDVDKAFKSWSSSFERVLHKIAMLQGHDVPQRAAAHRGQISFHEQRLHPRVMHDSASTLKGRALWKGYCRALELSKMAVGTRQEKTLAKLQSAKKWLSADHLVTFDALTIVKHFPKISGMNWCSCLKKPSMKTKKLTKKSVS